MSMDMAVVFREPGPRGNVMHEYALIKGLGIEVHCYTDSVSNETRLEVPSKDVKRAKKIVASIKRHRGNRTERAHHVLTDADKEEMFRLKLKVFATHEQLSDKELAVYRDLHIRATNEEFNAVCDRVDAAMKQRGAGQSA